MAVSDSTSKTIYNASGTNGYTLQIDWKENSTNVANNTSSVTITAKLISIGSAFDVSPYECSMELQWWDSRANAWTSKKTGSVSALAVGTTYTLTTTFNATHKDDGTLRGQAKVIWTAAGTSYYTPVSTELKNPTGQDMTVIPRTSTPTLSASTVEIGNNVTVNTNRASTSFTHDISVKIGSASSVSVATGVEDSYVFNTATYVATFVAQMSSAHKATAVFTVTTKSGSTTIGSKTVSMTVTLTASVPTLSSSTFNIGDSITVNTNRLSTTSARTHGLFVRYGTNSTARWIAQSGITTKQTYNSSTASHVGWIMSAAGTASSITATFVLQTIVNDEPIGTATVTGTIKINPSVPTVNPSTFTTGDTIKILTNRTTTARSHTLYVVIGSTETMVSSSEGSTQTGGDYPTGSSSAIGGAVLTAAGTTAASVSGTFKLDTFLSGVKIGTKSVAFTANVNTATYKPTITFGTMSERNAAVSAYHDATNSMINVLSKMRLPITFGITPSSATSIVELKSATVTFGTIKRTPAVSGSSTSYNFDVDGVQANTVTVTVTDKRGTTVTATKTFTLIGYAKPTITLAEVSRISMTGTDAKFTLRGTGYAGTYSGSSSVTNSITVSYTVKRIGSSGNPDAGATTYTPSLSGSGSKSWNLNDRTFTEQFDNDAQYDIIFTVRDAFSSISTSARRIYNGLPVYGWGETHFDVYGDLHLHKRSDASERWVLPDTFNAILANDGRKNLLPTRQSGDTVNNGITYSVKSSGRVAATGTATANASFIITLTWTEPTGNYFFSGIETGSASTGYVFVWDNAISERAKKWDRSTNVDSGVSNSKAYEVYLVNGQEYSFYYRIQEGATVSNLSWYPMVWDGRIASTDYVQYSPPGQSASTTGTNIDNLVAPGAYTVTNPTGTLPITSSYTQIYVLDSAYSWVSQIGVFNGNVYYRYKSNNSSAWDQWKRLSRERGTLASGNLDNVEVNTIYYLTTANTYTNAPSTAGILETIASTVGTKSQTLRNGASFYYRYGNSNGTWGSWYKVTATAV